MIDGAEVIFLLAVAQAAFRQPSGLVDAEIVDHVARPAAAVAGARQTLLGGEDAVAAMGGGVAAEIGLVAEQPEAIAHFPLDPDRTAARSRRRTGGRQLQRRRSAGLGRRVRACDIDQKSGKGRSSKRAHWGPGESYADTTSTKLWAEIWVPSTGMARICADLPDR